jgi:Na+/H+-dicarboxylate symporter
MFYTHRVSKCGYNRMKFWQKTVLALILGIVIGLFFQEKVLWLKAVGDGYLSLIRMVLIPLVFSSISVGICTVQDPAKLGRVGILMLFLYGMTTLFAVIEGMGACSLFQPGAGVSLGGDLAPQLHAQTTNLSDILSHIIPKNVALAFVDGNVLQVIFIAFLVGIALNACQEKARPLKDFLKSVSDVMIVITRMVISLTPIGVFAIIGWTAATFGIQAFIPMARFLVLYYAVCFFHIGVIFLPLIYKGAKIPIRTFFAAVWDALIMAFSTCSSAATLPVALNCATEKLKVSQRIANFMLPIGTTINMNGAAIFQGMSALFLCQMYGIHLVFSEIVTIVIVTVLSSLGSAGVPGTGFIMLTLVLSSVGIPLEGMALLAGIDRFREMISTLLNILGDLVCTAVVARHEGEIGSEAIAVQECAIDTV